MPLSPDTWDEWVPRVVALTLSLTALVFFIREGLEGTVDHELLLIYAGFVTIPGPIEIDVRRRRKRKEANGNGSA